MKEQFIIDKEAGSATQKCTGKHRAGQEALGIRRIGEQETLSCFVKSRLEFVNVNSFSGSENRLSLMPGTFLGVLRTENNYPEHDGPNRSVGGWCVWVWGWILDCVSCIGKPQSQTC